MRTGTQIKDGYNAILGMKGTTPAAAEPVSEWRKKEGEKNKGVGASPGDWGREKSLHATSSSVPFIYSLGCKRVAPYQWAQDSLALFRRSSSRQLGCICSANIFH